MLRYNLLEHGVSRSLSVVPSHMLLKHPGSVMRLCAKMSFLDSQKMRTGLERLFAHVVWSMTWQFCPMEKILRLERKVLI
jgi:hypothetical protein